MVQWIEKCVVSQVHIYKIMQTLSTQRYVIKDIGFVAICMSMKYFDKINNVYYSNIGIFTKIQKHSKIYKYICRTRYIKNKLYEYRRHVVIQYA